MMYCNESQVSGNTALHFSFVLGRNAVGANCEICLTHASFPAVLHPNHWLSTGAQNRGKRGKTGCFPNCKYRGASCVGELPESICRRKEFSPTNSERKNSHARQRTQHHRYRGFGGRDGNSG